MLQQNKTCYIFINGIKREVNVNQTIMQACESYGISIPHFCYHDRLSVAGNCRMCLVEETKSPKPLASCAVTVAPNMNIYTNTSLVKKAREGVLEFLLANHPLDCPICDQGGECDLQDQSLVFGGDRGRFYEDKRSVEDKNCGPLVKTIMTRCIHCTRCVRFASEVAGLNNFGITGRGSKMEIGFYIKNLLNSEVSGNIIDLCPVGALTSKPFSFKARSWELQSHLSIDTFDSMGSNLRIDTMGNKILRILPVVNKLVNDSWISDKARFSYDSYKTQRVLSPFIKTSDLKLKKTTWDVALSSLKNKIEEFSLGAFKVFFGSHVSLDLVNVTASLARQLGSNFLRYENALQLSGLHFTNRSNFLMNVDYYNIDSVDFVLLVGTNPRWESPVLNIKLKSLSKKNVIFYSIGFFSNLNYKVNHLGNDLTILSAIAEGRHFLTHYLLKAKNPLILVGSSVLNSSLQKLLINLQNSCFKFNKQLVSNFVAILHKNSTTIHAAELNTFGCNTNNLHESKEPSILYCINTSTPVKNNMSDFIVYQTSLGSDNLKNADLLLPAVTSYEESTRFINLNGFVQSTKAIFFDFGSAKKGKDIISLLSKSLGLRNPSLDDSYIREHSRLLNYYSNQLCVINFSCNPISFKNSIWSSSISNFYLDDCVSKTSKLMSLCSKSFIKPYTF